MTAARGGTKKEPTMSGVDPMRPRVTTDAATPPPTPARADPTLTIHVLVEKKKKGMRKEEVKYIFYCQT